jgi:hypothetical protein
MVVPFGSGAFCRAEYVRGNREPNPTSLLVLGPSGWLRQNCSLGWVRAMGRAVKVITDLLTESEAKATEAWWSAGLQYDCRDQRAYRGSRGSPSCRNPSDAMLLVNAGRSRICPRSHLGSSTSETSIPPAGVSPCHPHPNPALRPRSARHHARRVDRPTPSAANYINGLRSKEGKVRTNDLYHF